MATLSYKKFYIISPFSAYNECTNPSFELDTAGWTLYNSTIALSSAQQTHGLKSLQVTTQASLNSGVYYDMACLQNRVYSLEVDLKTGDNANYTIGIANTSWTVLASRVVSGRTFWNRHPYVFYSPAGNMTLRFFIYRNSAAGTTSFFIDGAYISDNASGHTYFDGDYIGFLKNQVDFAWEGTPHASRSWCSGLTNSSGLLYDLDQYCKIISTHGLGMGVVEAQTIPVNIGGSIFDDVIDKERNFGFICYTEGLQDIVTSKMNTIISLIRPDHSSPRQPIVIRYIGYDASNVQATEIIDIPCIYTGGLEDLSNAGYGKRFQMNFRAFYPRFENANEVGSDIGYQSSIGNVNYCAVRDLNGLWSTIGTGANNSVSAIYVARDGTEYFGGNFTTFNGSAHSRVVKRRISTFSAVDDGVNATVRKFIERSDGQIYILGAFTQTGLGAGMNRVALYNPATDTMTQVGTFPVAFEVTDGVLDINGDLYVICGDGVYKWNGAAWSEIGALSSLLGIAITISGQIYVSTLLTFYKLNDAKTGWVTLADLSLGNFAYPILVAKPNGEIYLFETTVSSSPTGYGKWTGTAIVDLGQMRDGANCGAYCATYTNDGIYVGGWFTNVNGIALPDAGFILKTDETIMPLDIDLPGSANILAIHKSALGKLYLGFDTTGTAYSSTSTLLVGSGAQSFPKIKITGAGNLYQIKNYMNGKTILFNNLTIMSGETLWLDLRPGYISFTSDLRGSMVNYILSGSNLSDFTLDPSGAYISALMLGTSGSPSITMTYRPNYWSLEQAKRL